MEAESFRKVMEDLAAVQEGLGKLAKEHQRLFAERDVLEKENSKLREEGLGKTESSKTALPLFARQAVPAVGDATYPVADDSEEDYAATATNSVPVANISGWMENEPSRWRVSSARNGSQVQPDRILLKWNWIVKAVLQSSQGYGLRSCWIMEPVNLSPAAQATGAEVINGLWAARGSWQLRVKTRFSVRATAAIKEEPEPDHVAEHKQYLVAIHPMSWKRASWVMLAMALMVVETLMFSMQAYENDPFGSAGVLELVAAVFWTVDILVSFITGTVHSDRIELRLGAIAWRYARKWFAFDAFLCLLGWFAVVLLPEHSDSTSRTVVSCLRLSRIVRFAKFGHLMSESLARLNSIRVVLGVKMLFTTLCLVLWIHAGGCVWYYIGEHTNDGWVHRLHLSEAELEHKYILATHWAVGQLQGGVDIYPGNPVSERVYAVGYTMFSISVLGAFVSKLTNVMFELHEINKRRTWEWRIVCQMLSAHKISLETSSRIKAYICWKQHFDQKREMDAQEIIQNLPTELGRTLLIEMRMPYITPHPVFGGVRLIHEHSFLKMCSESFIPHTPIVDEQIYCHGDRCAQMYFIVGGSVIYVHYGAAAQAMGNAAATFGMGGFESPDSAKRVARRNKSLELTRDMILNEGRWLCEASLWLRWLHRGDLTTKSRASLLVLSPESFSAVAAKHPALHVALNSHARRFARTLDCVTMFFVTDLYDTSAAVASMHQSSAVAFSG